MTYTAQHPVDGWCSEDYARQWLARSFARQAQKHHLRFGPITYHKKGHYLVAEAQTQ